MRTQLLVLTALLAGSTFGALAQERMKPRGPAGFETLHADVGKFWNAGQFGKCYGSARELLGVIAQRRGDAIRAAIPVPEGLQAVEQPDQNPQAAAMLAAMTAAVGNVIEQEFRGQGKSVHVTVTADSPMLQMFKMIVDNPAMLQPNQELVKYAECSAVLETEARRVTLRLLLGDSLVEGQFEGYDADGALKVFDQAAVTKLNAAIAQ